ncbi:MAG: THUMP domain-containing protein, partial [Methanolinea sp.]|nr:THUMP domain-containing protein [Methanolinea sp.]
MNVLISNIRAVMPQTRIRSERGRIWLEGDVDPSVLKNIFGVVSFSEADHVPLTGLESGLLSYCHSRGMETARSFAVRIKRVGSHPFTSHEKAIECGNLIRNEFPAAKVNLDSPEKEIFLEIRGQDCYLYDTVTRAVGGLPLGVEGTLVALVSGGIDSPVAAWMMMKRGCRIIPLFVYLEGVLDESNYRRSRRVIEALRAYQPGIDLRTVNDLYLSSAHQELATSGQEKYTCLLCKRRMYRVAESFARSVGAKGIVTGESLGQVASQTLDNLLVLDEAAGIPVYRPLIGFDKEEIVRVSREIGTFL